MDDIDLEHLIRTYVPLGTFPNGRGWFPVVCQVCNDHGNKGARAAFCFEGDGIGYHCFNCNHKAAFNKHQAEPVSRNMITVFHAYNIPETEWNQLDLMVMENRGEEQTTNPKVAVQSIEPDVIKLPPNFKKIQDYPEDNPFRFIAEDTLLNERGIKISDYNFYLADEIEGDSESKKWVGRIIIPIYNRKGQVIFYQGRSMIDHPRKYLSPSIDKSKILFGYDEIYNHSKLPLYVVEGYFDAWHLKGCATLGNKLTDEQIEHLSRSRRQKVIIPDKFGDGHIMAEQAIELGWSVSTPNVGECKDMCEAINKYGLIYILKTIANETAEGFVAETNINLYCES